MGKARDGESSPFSREAPETVVITASRGWVPLNLRELWSYRELMYYFVWRDIKVRYRQTLFGAAWAFFRPFVLIVVFSVVFGRIAKVDSIGLPYPVFSAVALVPWGLFQSALSASSDSLLSSAGLLTKIYFPRLLVPIGSAAVFLIDFAIGMAVIVSLMLFYDISFTLRALWAIPLTLLAFIAALALGTWFSSLNVRYRDLRFLVPFMLQVLLFASPIGYSSVELKGWIRLAYAINPMTAVADGFRWALLGADTSPGPLVVVSSAATLLILISGLLYFKRVERTFADVI